MKIETFNEKMTTIKDMLEESMEQKKNKGFFKRLFN